MAKIVYACVRDIANAASVKRRIESIIHKLAPDNIPDARCKVVDNGKIIYGISTYTSILEESGDSVCMGLTHDSHGKWWEPRTEHPDGNYAIFRANEDYVEAITDFACTRALWYYKDETVFIAGTSQRAVINVAGKFEMEKRNIPWMLSSGGLAPFLSWCKNVSFVEPDGSVLLNRKTWELTTKSVRAKFPIAEISDEQSRLDLKKSLVDFFSKLDVDLSKWILPISGGYDSRGIACLLKETGKDISRLDTITWGNHGSEKNKNSDAYVGAAAAKSLGMNHKFLATDARHDSPEKVIERFIICSEGRTDNIGGYADGMTIWKNIFESGKHGIIRGDETFGMKPSNNYLRARLTGGCRICTDFSNLANYEQYGVEKQEIPEYFKADPSRETPALYRDRLYQGFRIPLALTALSDIKYAYTEILNPFLTRNIVQQSRTLPDHLRNNRSLFKKIISEISPNIPYANQESTDEDILKTPAVIKLFTIEFGLDYMKELFPEEFLQKTLITLQKPSTIVNNGMLSKLKMTMGRSLPLGIKEKLIKSMPKPVIDIGMLAFRIYITGKIYKMFTEDVAQAND